MDKTGDWEGNWLSFVEEAVMNPKYFGYIGGRIEVQRPEDVYHSEEIRFFTIKQEEFYKLREEWDNKTVTDEELSVLRKIVENSFCDKI